MRIQSVKDLENIREAQKCGDLSARGGEGAGGHGLLRDSGRGARCL